MGAGAEPLASGANLRVRKGLGACNRLSIKPIYEAVMKQTRRREDPECPPMITATPAFRECRRSVVHIAYLTYLIF